MSARIAANRVERISLASGRCEATGLHHSDCPGYGSVIHHVFRRGDSLPLNVCRDDIKFLRWVWNGSTGLGAGGCHGRVHSCQGEARELGLLAPYPVHSLTFTPIGWLTSTGLLL